MVLGIKLKPGVIPTITAESLSQVWAIVNCSVEGEAEELEFE